MAAKFVDVLVPVALDQTYSYRLPRGLALAPGEGLPERGEALATQCEDWLSGARKRLDAALAAKKVTE